MSEFVIVRDNQGLRLFENKDSEASIVNRLKRLWRRISAFVSVLIQTAGVLSAILTILTVLGAGSATFGYFSNLLPLMVTGIVVFFLSALLFIFLYTLLEEKM